MYFGTLCDCGYLRGYAPRLIPRPRTPHNSASAAKKPPDTRLSASRPNPSRDIAAPGPDAGLAVTAQRARQDVGRHVRIIGHGERRQLAGAVGAELGLHGFDGARDRREGRAVARDPLARHSIEVRCVALSAS